MPLEIQAATGNALSDIEYISQGEKELYKCWMKLSLQSVHFTFTRSLSISVMQLILKFYFYFWFFLLFFGSYLAVLWGRVGRCSARTFPTGFILFDFSCLDAGPAELLDLSQRGFPFFAAGHLLPGSQAVVRRVSHQHQQHSEKYLLPFVGKRLSLPQPSYSNQHPPPPPWQDSVFLENCFAYVQPTRLERIFLLDRTTTNFTCCFLFLLDTFCLFFARPVFLYPSFSGKNGDVISSAIK